MLHSFKSQKLSNKQASNIKGGTDNTAICDSLCAQWTAAIEAGNDGRAGLLELRMERYGCELP